MLLDHCTVHGDDWPCRGAFACSRVAPIEDRNPSSGDADAREPDDDRCGECLPCLGQVADVTCWRNREQENAAVLPNGYTAFDVYEAYEIGKQQGKLEASACPVCGFPRSTHTRQDVWNCIDQRANGGNDE